LFVGLFVSLFVVLFVVLFVELFVELFVVLFVELFVVAVLLLLEVSPSSPQAAAKVNKPKRASVEIRFNMSTPSKFD